MPHIYNENDDKWLEKAAGMQGQQVNAHGGGEKQQNNEWHLLTHT